MSGMLHFIDFHQLLFTNRRTAEQHTALINLQGLEEGQRENPLEMRIHAVRTWTEKKREKMAFFLEEERRSSQVETPRSPSIVARLMGLELLPENNPHDHSQKKMNKNNKQHHLRKPLQVKDSNTINHSSPPSPLPHKLKSRIKAISRHGYNNENENENIVKEVKKHCKKNKEAKKNTLCSRTEEQKDEYQYVRLVLDYAFKFQRLNPEAIFNLLELELEFPRYSQLRHRWNRKLLFHLVGEIVGDLIHGHGFTNNMLERVWREIRSCPLADCKVIGDIDALIEGDIVLGNVRRLMRHPAVLEDMARVVAEVEKDIVEELVNEMVMMMMTMSWVGFNDIVRVRRRWMRNETLSLRHIYSTSHDLGALNSSAVTKP
ncbi:hypothetical protein DsansV1_C29g0209011 [Dioscorea sansibarensis]